MDDRSLYQTILGLSEPWHVSRVEVDPAAEEVRVHPERDERVVKRALLEAFRTADADRAGRLLANMARSLDEPHPGAARSLREGLDGLLTVKRLGPGG